MAAEKLLVVRSAVQGLLDDMQGEIKRLHKTYQDLVASHGKGKGVFGVDSLHFQITLIETDHAYITNSMKTIDNRVYFEYWSTYGTLREYVLDDLRRPEIVRKIESGKTFPNYRHLDKETHYDVETAVNDIRTCILAGVEELKNVLEERKATQTGIDLDN